MKGLNQLKRSKGLELKQNLKPDMIKVPNEKINKLLKKLIENKEELINSLLDYESYETTIDEIKRSIDCLKNLDKELKFFSSQKVDVISSFFPLNLPLYSFILFALVPSFMCNRIFVRPSKSMRNVLNNLIHILNVQELFPNIKIIEMHRNIFLEGFVSTSDVILFTGLYENALKVKNSCRKDSLFIYNGAGINPIIVTKDADVNLATRKIVEARTFNSGQDCAGPDAILVDKKITSRLTSKIKSILDSYEIGDYHNKNVKIGKIIDFKKIDKVNNFIEENKRDIIYGGEIDFKRSIVQPTIFLKELKKFKHYREFFCPIFVILEYEKERDLFSYFVNPKYKDFAMYVSIFGNLNNIDFIKHSVLLSNKIILDIEKGNEVYGGFGKKANFVSFDEEYFSRPILISKEIYEYVNKKNGFKK